MSFLIDERYLPATLTVPPMTDEQFAAFCAEHADLEFEMSAEGELMVMAPRYSITSARNQQLTRQLGNWAEAQATGIGFDPSGGFVLPNGARRSPDASWVSSARIPDLSQEGYWHLCPDFVIEIRSSSDRLTVLRRKMREYLENGAQLGWLIDPDTRSVEIYRPNAEPETLTAIDSINGEGPVSGFVLDLERVWNPRP